MVDRDLIKKRLAEIPHKPGRLAKDAAARAMLAALHAYYTDNKRFHKMSSDAIAAAEAAGIKSEE